MAAYTHLTYADGKAMVTRIMQVLQKTSLTDAERKTAAEEIVLHFDERRHIEYHGPKDDTYYNDGSWSSSSDHC